MFNPPIPNNTHVKDLIAYVIDEKFITVSSYEIIDRVTFMTFTCTLTKRQYVMENTTLYYLMSIVVTDGYGGLLNDVTDALSYFDHYDSDYLATVLSQMEVKTDDDHLIQNIDKYKLISYYFRIHSDCKYVEDFIADLELYLLS